MQWSLWLLYGCRQKLLQKGQKLMSLSYEQALQRQLQEVRKVMSKAVNKYKRTPSSLQRAMLTYQKVWIAYEKERSEES